MHLKQIPMVKLPQETTETTETAEETAKPVQSATAKAAVKPANSSKAIADEFNDLFNS